MKLYAYNKPIGTIAAAGEVAAIPAGAEAVEGVFPTENVTLYPVSELAEDSKGLVIMTDDASQVEALKVKLADCEMEFHVDVDHPFNTPVIQKIRADHACKISWTEADGTVISIKPCSEQILKSIMAGEGYNVRLLKKYRVANLKIKKVALGAYAEYTEAEVAAFLA